MYFINNTWINGLHKMKTILISVSQMKVKVAEFKTWLSD